MVKKSLDYHKGFSDGYKKAMEDSIKIRDKVEKEFGKPMRDAINKLRSIRH